LSGLIILGFFYFQFTSAFQFRGYVVSILFVF
jgi:hypothetical protein